MTRKRGRAVLPLIAGLLLLSGTLRLGIGASAAWAENAAPAAEGETAGAACIVGATTGDLLASLQARDAELTDREGRLADRDRALTLVQTEIDEKIAALAEAEQSLAALIAVADSAAENDLSQLTLVYENMKPADAALLFQSMEAGFAAGFMGRMTPQAAAAIMADLPPETAYAISAILAGRNAGAPTE